MSSKIMVIMFSLFAELERDSINVRTKEALTSKKHKALSLENLKARFKKANLMHMLRESKNY